jgi:hypothetical protein
MSISRALVSWKTSVNDAFRTDHLKLCYLWYDEVLLETLSGRDDLYPKLIEDLVKYENNAEKLARQLTDSMIPLADRVSLRALPDITREVQRGYPRWGEGYENYTYPEPEIATEYAHNHLLSLLEQEHGVQQFVGWEIEQAEGRARIAVDAAALWESVNISIPCMLQADADEKEAMIAMQQFRSSVAAPVDPVRLLDLAVPSFADVSWEKVVALRNSSDLDLLKKKVREAAEYASSDLTRAKAILEGFERVAIESIVEFGRPQVKRVAIESSIANIPLGPVNPHSLYVAGRDTAAAIKRRAEVGWLYMLRDIRSAGEQEDNRILPL